ncbi:MAG: gephyrin-like molybdotransferase Glp [Gemmataceae bacterium]
MISVSEGQRLVLERAAVRPAKSVQLGPEAIGLVLAEEVASDVDSPPYDKAMMDGYAFRHADLAAGKGRLHIIEEITAGKVPARTIGAGQAARIMTGAPIPQGADTVVMHERTRPADGDDVEIDDASLQPGKNIMLKAQEMKRGDIVLAPGTVLRGAELGVLASVGRASVQAHPAPRVAIVATGDELVDAPAAPGPGQIRNSNGPMLMALAQSAGAVPGYLGIARDQLDELRAKVKAGLESDLLVLSGGVSAGKLDLVPGVLAEFGVESIFHKVEMKPGKPVFFGTRGSTLIFGLPGNPVSALVCFELFAAPALR